MVLFEQPAAAAKPITRYTVQVRYSAHCFTVKPRDGERIPPELVYVENGELRIFDAQRYELSRSLPTIVQSLMLRQCYHTGYTNCLTIELIDGSGKPQPYEIYFRVARSSQGGILELFIESGYIRVNARRDTMRRKPIRFSVVLYNTLHKRAIVRQQ